MAGIAVAGKANRRHGRRTSRREDVHVSKTSTVELRVSRHPYNNVKLGSPSKAPFAMLVIKFELRILWLGLESRSHDKMGPTRE